MLPLKKPIWILIFFAAFFYGCVSKTEKESFPEKPPEIILENLGAESFSQKALLETGLFQLRLKKKYSPRFNFSHGKFFLIACRCSDREITNWQNIIHDFQEKVYSHFFLKKYNEFFKVVFFKNREEYKWETASINLSHYDSEQKTIFTNLQVSRQTLFHEIMHVFIDLNSHTYPPHWFREGLASLFEAGIPGDWFSFGLNWRQNELRKSVNSSESKYSLKNLFAQKIIKEPEMLSLARLLFVYLSNNKVLIPFVQDFLGESKIAKQWPVARQIQILEEKTQRSLTEIEQALKKY